MSLLRRRTRFRESEVKQTVESVKFFSNVNSAKSVDLDFDGRRGHVLHGSRAPKRKTAACSKKKQLGIRVVKAICRSVPRRSF